MSRCLFRSLFFLTPLALAGCGGDKAFVVSNIAPAVTIDSPEDGTIFTDGQPIEIRGRVRDDGDVTNLIMEWESSIDGALEDNDPPDPDGLVELVTSNLSGGVHIITLRATDPGGEQAEDTVQIEVEQQPDIPSLEILHPDPLSDPPVNGVVDIPFTFVAQVSDPTDVASDLEVEVSAEPGGFLCAMSPDGTGRGSCSAALPLGVHSIVFVVTDTDGFSADASTTLVVLEPGDADLDGDGYSPNGGDCNDSSITIFPGAPEVCDGLDNDCNPATAIDVNSPCYDDDGDGYCEGPPCTNATSTIPDCNDANPDARPGGTEVCNNADDNCDGQVDEGLGAEVFWYDGDGDGYGAGNSISSCSGAPAGHVSESGDCDDTNPNLNPGRDEIQNGIDDNCNGQIDEAGPTYDDDGDGYCEAPPCTNATGTSPDCDDANDAINPAAIEVCGDSIDNNCDGVSNEENAVGCQLFYPDADSDSYGGLGASACYCEAQYPYTAGTGTDCDDNNAQVNPGQSGWFSAGYYNSGGQLSYDYNCDGSSTQRWTTGSSGCNVAGIGCNGNDGWLGGSIPGCGTAQGYQDDCGLDIGSLLLGCGLGCAFDCLSIDATCFQCILSVCPSSQVCEQDSAGRVQECH